MFVHTSSEKKIYSSIHKKNTERNYFLKSFRRKVEKYEHIFLFPHINPDGDCIGGVLGFKQVLKENYPEKKIYAVGSSFGLYSGLHQEFDAMPKNFDFSKAMAITIDVGVKSRVQQYSEYFEEAKTKFGDIVKIDHHESPPDINYTLYGDDGTYVAACVQLVQIADYYGGSLTPKAATYLYLGIYTDSQRFLFPSTVARSLVIAAKTGRAGADYRLIHRKLTLRTGHSLAVDQYLLANCNKEGHIIGFHLTLDIIKEQKITHTKGLVNVFQNIENVKVGLMFTDTVDGTIQAEFRSMGADVRTLAIQFGGGGHENASGALIKDSNLIPVIVAAARKLADSFTTSEDELHDKKERKPEVLEEVKSSQAAVKEAKSRLKEIKKEVGDNKEKNLAEKA